MGNDLAFLQGKILETVGGKNFTSFSRQEMASALLSDFQELESTIISTSEKSSPEEELEQIKFALANSFFSLCCIANQFGVNLEESVFSMLEKNDRKVKERFLKKHDWIEPLRWDL